jgi:type IV fimbrial biogenesis protein FimT
MMNNNIMPAALECSRSRSAIKHARQGFTLIELMVVITVLAVLLGVGVPSFRALIIKTRLKNASFDVFSSIVAARSEAITRNTTVTITPNSGDWAKGWVITDTGSNTLKTQDAFTNLTVTGPATLVYSSSGRASASANCGSGKPCISLNAADAVASDGRCVTIDLSGRPATTTGVCP